MDVDSQRTDTSPFRLLLLSQTLGYGGAERQMVTLARALHERGHAVSIAVFYPDGPLEPELRAAGVPVHVLGKKHRWDVAGFGMQLVQLVRRERPDILHGYLQIPNLICAVLKPLFPRVRVVWGVRGSYIDLSRYDRLVRWTHQIEPKLARFADRIIANSRAGRDWVVSQGFPADRLHVIPNGIDTVRFRPCQEDRERVRAEWNIAPDELLIGLVARLDPIKDHLNFIQAAAQAAAQDSRLRFVCVGEAPSAPYAERLREECRERGLESRLIWSPPRKDMPAVYNALDLLTLTSYGEGFPNVIGEAMASEVPCVVTDAGDSAWVVGDAGLVVPCRDPQRLADGYEMLLKRNPSERKAMGTAARHRITSMFSVETLTMETERVLRAELRPKRKPLPLALWLPLFSAFWGMLNGDESFF